MDLQSVPNMLPYINMIKKIYNAFKKHFFKDPAYFCLYSFRYFQSNYRHTCKFYTNEDFVKQIESGKSIIRIGDGEIALIHFFSLVLSPQVYSDAIRKDIIDIIKTYTIESPYIIGLPYFVNYSNKELSRGPSNDKFTSYMPLKITYEMLFNKRTAYFDQLIFYKKGGFELLLPYIKTKKIIIVTNEENHKLIHDTNILSVTTTDKNSYEERYDIMNQIEVIAKHNKKDYIVLFAAGLCKTIIPELANKGYQALDIGIGLKYYYEDYKNVNVESLT